MSNYLAITLFIFKRIELKIIFSMIRYLSLMRFFEWKITFIVFEVFFNFWQIILIMAICTVFFSIKIFWIRKNLFFISIHVNVLMSNFKQLNLFKLIFMVYFLLMITFLLARKIMLFYYFIYKHKIKFLLL